MEEQIIKILGEDKNKAYSAYQLNDALGLKTAEELRDLLDLLEQLELEAKIYRTKKDNYMLLENSHLKIGTFLATKKSFGFVDIPGDEDVFIAPPNMLDALQGDKVVVEIISKAGFKLEGKIIKIIERDIKNQVGEIYFKNDNCYVELDDEKLKIEVFIPKELTLGAVEGHKVLVKLEEQIDAELYSGQIIKVIGHKNDPGVDISSIVHKLGISDEFSDEVMAETEKVATVVTEAEIQGRRDLRNKKIFTIDGDDTKDIDDAISLDKLENGNYLLGVHIADVSYYVKENSMIDAEAYERGTSVYLADRVIPMYPHKLSNGICSLNEQVDRLAVSCSMEIAPNGDIVNYEMFESVIKSNKQLTYKKVNEIFEGNKIPEGYEPFAEVLLEMRKVSDMLRKRKVSKGYINFNINESQIVVDENGTAIDVVLRETGRGQSMIEDFMVAANETVASAIFYMELPFIYRVHGKPNEDKLTEFLSFVRILGHKLNIKIKESKITSKLMQEILDALEDVPEYNMLSTILLRSMQKAIYDETNIGHFGLASPCYTHFTSPIRRYPDTTVHRLIRTYLFNQKMDMDTIKFWEQKLPILAEHTSSCEQLAVECERSVDDMKKAEYMMQHIGEEFEGMISGVTGFGMFIELPNLIEGLIKLDDMKDDFYVFDETTFSMIGRRTKKRYRLGDKIRVIVKNASKESHTVDFEPVSENKDKKLGEQGNE